MLLIFFASGSALFSFGVYYALPEISKPLQKVFEKLDSMEHDN
jgi:hypothetical protein